MDEWTRCAISHAMSRAVEFPGEEAGGRFLDLSVVRQVYLNLRKLREYNMKLFIRNQWAKYTKILPSDSANSREDYDDFTRKRASLFRPMDYVAWLRNFGDFQSIPRCVKYRQDDYLVGSWSLYLYSIT